MELLKAVKMRRSIRAFKPDPVPKEIILELLGVATRAPSGVNSQPWEFFIISGKTLNNVRQAYVEQYRAGIVPNPDVTIPKVGKLAPKLQGVYKERQILLVKQIYDVYGITKENTKACTNIMKACTGSSMRQQLETDHCGYCHWLSRLESSREPVENGKISSRKNRYF